MDFHSLSRKELQTLCKKNKIPANMTNVAMADALASLPQVEGLDEFLNPTEAEAGAGTPGAHHRTACRTSTLRKPLREEPQSSKVVSSQRPQRGTRRAGNGEGVVVAEQENKDANVVQVTPASRKRATAVSSRRKKEPEMVEDDKEKNRGHGKPIDVPKTPAALPRSRTRATGRKTEGPSVQQAYNTRRSVRLLEKNLSKMSLTDTEDNGLEKIDDVSEGSSSVSQRIEDAADTEEVSDAGASLQTLSNVFLEETDELEVSSLEKKTECEPQVPQVHDSGSEVQLVSAAEIDVGPGLEAEPEEEDPSLEADFEPHDSNLKLEGSSETLEEDSNEVLDRYDVSDVDMDKSTGESTVHADNIEGSELLSELEDSCDSSEAENKECLGTKQEALSVEASANASMECAEQDVAALTVEVTEDAPIEVTDQDVAALTVEVTEDAPDQDVAGSLPMSPVSEDSAWLKEFLDCNTDNQGEKEADDNQNKNKNDETEHLNVEDGNYIQHFEPEVKLENPEESLAENEKDLARPKGALELDLSNNVSSGEHLEEESEVKLENPEESMAEVEKMHNASSVIIDASSAIASEKDNANENSENTIDVIEVCNESSAEESTNGEDFNLQSSVLDDHHLEEFEAKSEHLEESVEEVEKVIDGASDVTGASSADIALKDASASYENSISVEVCAESSADVKHVTLESSLVDVSVQEAGEQKDISYKLKDKAQSGESNDHAAAEASEVVIPKQESCVLLLPEIGTMTVPAIDELKASDIPMQPVVAEQSQGGFTLCPAQSETQTVPKIISIEDNMHNSNMKENLTTDELQQKSIRELKKMLKKLNIDDGKSNCKSKTNNVVKEVERKRTALQELPENQMAKGATQ